MITVVDLHRVARDLQIPGHWRMNKAELEKATGYNKEVPPHLSFMELLAMDYERYAEKLAEQVVMYRSKLSAYANPPYQDTDLIVQWRRNLRIAEADLADVCHWAAHYRCQAAL